jgi:hypothetical protein
MNLKMDQRGVSLGGLLTWCVIVGFGALMLMKLWPIYNEKMKVDQAMAKLATNPDGPRMGKTAFAKALMRQFDVNDVDSFSTKELQDTLKVGREKGSKNKIVTLAYEIRGPFFANMDIVMNYNNSIEFGPAKTD